MSSVVEYGDVQGIVRFGHKHMTQACYLLLRVKNARAARAWLRAAQFASAVQAQPLPSQAMQVAFTAAGLKALGAPARAIAQFSPEFLAGMTEPNRSRRLGDVGANAPSQWQWGNAAAPVHLMLMLFATPGSLESLMRSFADELGREAFDVVAQLDTSDLQGREPFGFNDGISQPELDWQMRRALDEEQTTYGNLVALGEFLLGYRNEYNKYTSRPVLDLDAGSSDLPPAEDAPEKKDLGRNGTYLVLRHLRQDVRGFWQYVEQEARANALPSESLAAALVGRTREGAPLVSSPDLNTFTYDGDPSGTQCPFGAHVRRSNPRTSDYSPPSPHGAIARLTAALGLRRGAFRDDLVSSTRFHRILRRGREYGPGLPPAQALAPAPPDDPERGLRFICVNANISRQFEFLQNAWLMSSGFNGMNGESDPLLGNRQALPGCPAAADFTMPQHSGMDRRIARLPQFVTVRGGAYFFLPGLRALRYLTGVDA